ncbi:MAG: hypothetical protein UT42_C0005G0019 [Candidatus Falkowbacteria bacterium GW2011_GWA2_39_24]|uniref:HNH endonuclease n=1 Tax=Candidatus Falkowbacteria bacterium GW2011_GWA2_39_24 TaxID=1618634 RepID=A0A0G0NGN2_9BACT|nr:MAG: hypothetical protein UT42_C0005G0019 [Candidatus Falkowbacteria bacterium GW2011_GWA2_39_24]
MAKRLEECPKCKAIKDLVDHHPFPRRYYGNGKNNNPHSIYLCDACHRQLDNKIINEVIRIGENIARQPDRVFTISPQLFVAMHVEFFGSLEYFLQITESRIYYTDLERNAKRNKNNHQAIRLPNLDEIVVAYNDMTFAEIFGSAQWQIRNFLDRKILPIDETRNSKKKRRKMRLIYQKQREASFAFAEAI